MNTDRDHRISDLVMSQPLIHTTIILHYFLCDPFVHSYSTPVNVPAIQLRGQTIYTGNPTVNILASDQRLINHWVNCFHMPDSCQKQTTSSVDMADQNNKGKNKGNSDDPCLTPRCFPNFARELCQCWRWSEQLGLLEKGVVNVAVSRKQ